MNIKSFSGWALDRACEVDRAVPGFLGTLFRSSQERRQVVFTYFSVNNPAMKFETDAALGIFLAEAGHHEILAAAVGIVPDGLRSTLGRSGDRPHPRRHYRYLSALMANPGRSSMSAIVGRLDHVTPERLQIIRALPDALRDVRLVTALRTANDARDVAQLYRLLTRAGVQEVALVQALSMIKTMADVRRLASRWSQRVTFPCHPIPAAPGYEPITTGAALKEAALRFRNCSRNYIPRIMEGRSAYSVVSRDGAEAMAHLICGSDGWEVDALYGPGNCLPDASLERWAEHYLAGYGLMPRVNRRTEREWACLRRLDGHLDIEMD